MGSTNSDFGIGSGALPKFVGNDPQVFEGRWRPRETPVKYKFWAFVVDSMVEQSDARTSDPSERDGPLMSDRK